MGNTLFKLLIALGLDTKEYEEELDKTKQKTQTKTQAIAGSLQDIGKGLSKVGQTMTATITAPVVAGAVVSIKAASDLNETVSKIGVVFDDQADSVLAFGRNSAEALGMSTNDALAAAGTYGNLFRSMDIGTATSAKMSTGLVQLASDLASFNNLDPTEVLDALRAGLTGETEPLKRLGININEAVIKAKAMQMGLADASGALTAGAKAQTVYALVMEQTKLAQGDFARTSSGLANQQRILTAELANASAQIGQILLPYVLKIVQGVNGLLKAFTSLPAPVQQVIVIIALVAAAIGPLLIVIGSLMGAIGSITAFLAGPAVAAIGSVIAAAAPVILIILAIIAVVVLLYLAWQSNFLGIQDIVGAVVGYVIGCWNNFLAAIKVVWNWLSTVLFPFFQALANLFNAVLMFAIRQVENEFKAFRDALQPVYDFIQNNIFPVFKRLGDWLGNTFGPIIQKAADALKNIFGGAFDWVNNKIKELTKWIQDLADWINSLGRGPGSQSNSIGQENSLGPGSGAPNGWTPPPGPGAVGGSGTRPGMTTNNVTNNFNIFSRENPGAIQNALTLSQMMGGAA